MMTRAKNLSNNLANISITRKLNQQPEFYGSLLLSVMFMLLQFRSTRVCKVLGEVGGLAAPPIIISHNYNNPLYYLDIRTRKVAAFVFKPATGNERQ